MSLIPANELKKTFSVYAHFYKIEVDGKEYLMRSEAEIIRNGSKVKQTDAIIVMINPGSCSAKDEIGDFDTYPYNFSAKKFVEARPDPTQYQLMNLMVRMNWDSMKIINLSDIANGKFSEFKRLLIELEANDYMEHSIFCQKRKNELDNLLENEPTLIYAWGGNNALKKCKDSLKNKYKHICLEHPEESYCLHPNPLIYDRRVAWLDEMEKLLKG